MLDSSFVSSCCLGSFHSCIHIKSALCQLQRHQLQRHQGLREPDFSARCENVAIICAPANTYIYGHCYILFEFADCRNLAKPIWTKSTLPVKKGYCMDITWLNPIASLCYIWRLTTVQGPYVSAVEWKMSCCPFLCHGHDVGSKMLLDFGIT
jgi:hypothetical protein